MNYQPWITNWLSTHNPYGRCKEAATEMQKVFPDLTIVRGHADTDWGRRAHWWIVTTEGDVVDPTASQFGAVFAYDPWKPGDEVRVGKCMNCGDEIWKPLQTIDKEPQRECICGEECDEEYRAYLEQEQRHH